MRIYLDSSLLPRRQISAKAKEQLFIIPFAIFGRTENDLSRFMLLFLSSIAPKYMQRHRSRSIFFTGP